MKKLLILLCLPIIGFGQITGCMDSLACNYDSLATFNNGNCIYSAMAPYNEDFSSGLIPQGDSCSWLQNALIGDGWRFDGLPGYAAAYNGRDTGSYAWIDFSNQDSSVILEIESIDISNLTLPCLFFDFYSYVDTFGNSPPLNILNIETWDGTSWIWQGSYQLNNPAWTTQFKYLNNTTYINNLVKIRFRAESSVGADYFNDLLIDNVKVQEYLLGCTDSLACNYDSTATISNSSCIYLNDSVIITPPSCYGINDGSVSINSSGGSFPYQYSLNGNPSQSNGIFTNLFGGTYSLVVTDASGCTSTQTFTITEPNPLNVSIYILDPLLCYGDSFATVVANPDGGTLPYIFNWTSGQITDTVSNLSAGTYSVVVVDNNGCNDFTTITINNPSAIISNNNLNGCDSVLIGSNYYSTSGIYSDSLTSVNGCDSIVNTNLNILQNTASYDTLSVVANIVWNGIPLNVSGDYSVILVNSLGCDSIVNLNLTITIPSSILNITNTEKTIVKITNMLGQEIPNRKNTTLFYIYDDGTVEKRIVID